MAFHSHGFDGMKPITHANHPPRVHVPDDDRPLVAPIHQTVKFEFDDTAPLTPAPL